jgi:hypothetical protein
MGVWGEGGVGQRGTVRRGGGGVRGEDGRCMLPG